MLFPLDPDTTSNEELEIDIEPETTTTPRLLKSKENAETPAGLDVSKLEEELDRRLQEQHAKETGICPVRRELYSQCFGE